MNNVQADSNGIHHDCDHYPYNREHPNHDLEQFGLKWVKEGNNSHGHGHGRDWDHEHYNNLYNSYFGAPTTIKLKVMTMSLIHSQRLKKSSSPYGLSHDCDLQSRSTWQKHNGHLTAPMTISVNGHDHDIFHYDCDIPNSYKKNF